MLRVHAEDGEATVVFATATGATCHLQVLGGRDGAKVAAIELLEAGEDDGAGGEIEPDGEGRSGEDHLEVPIAEQNLNQFL